VRLVVASVTPAVIALVGTVVGALIGGGTNLLLAWAKRRNEARATARLVEDELRAAEAIVNDWIVKEKSRPSAGDRERLVASAWIEGRSVLAHSFIQEDWEKVRDAYSALDKVRRSLEGGRAPGQPELEELEKTVGDGRKTLSSEGRDRPAARLRAGANKGAGKLCMAIAAQATRVWHAFPRRHRRRRRPRA
jgi:gas vesicle protein